MLLLWIPLPLLLTLRLKPEELGGTTVEPMCGNNCCWCCEMWCIAMAWSLMGRCCRIYWYWYCSRRQIPLRLQRGYCSYPHTDYDVYDCFCGSIVEMSLDASYCSNSCCLTFLSEVPSCCCYLLLEETFVSVVCCICCWYCCCWWCCEEDEAAVAMELKAAVAPPPPPPIPTPIRGIPPVIICCYNTPKVI
jgi:hypothetical protein